MGLVGGQLAGGGSSSVLTRAGFWLYPKDIVSTKGLCKIAALVCGLDYNNDLSGGVENLPTAQLTSGVGGWLLAPVFGL